MWTTKGRSQFVEKQLSIQSFNAHFLVFHLFRSNYLYRSFNAHFLIFPCWGINEKRWSQYVLPHIVNFHLSEPWYALVLQPLKHFFTEFREEICRGFDFIHSSLHVVVIFYISVSQNSPAKRLVGFFLKTNSSVSNVDASLAVYG